MLNVFDNLEIKRTMLLIQRQINASKYTMIFVPPMANQGFWKSFLNSCATNILQSVPSLIVADEDIEPQIFWASPKVMLPQHIYACNFVVITLVCPTKVSIMKLKCNLLSRMWQHDFLMKQILFSSIFLSENKGRLAKQAGYPGHDP
jgi:hypothetical protein